MIRRRILTVIVIAAAAVAAVFIVRAIMNAARVMSQESAARENKTSTGIAITKSEILHLSFPQLSVTEGEGRISVADFTAVLEDLYEKGYMLVDVHDLADVSEDGIFHAPVLQGFPENKKPLIISERDVSYPFERIGDGYAKKMVLDEDGAVKCEYDQLYGEGTLTGDYDLVPVLETFISEHPDFSFEGARGVLGLTGKYGILGYRTTPYLSDFEGNPYAESYGLFDTEIEKEDAVAVASALTDSGWYFALNGYGDVSYGSELSIVQEDIDNWISEVSPLIEDTDLCIFPYDTDIGSWQPYTSDNAKYQYLKNKGFDYFFINTTTDSLLQIGDDYVREGIFEIDTAKDYDAVIGKLYEEEGTAE